MEAGSRREEGPQGGESVLSTGGARDPGRHTRGEHVISADEVIIGALDAFSAGDRAAWELQ